MYFLLGSLPWQGLKLPPGAANNASGKHRLILQKKQATPLDELCASCPPQFQEYLTYCRSLKFEAKPNMNYVRARAPALPRPRAPRPPAELSR